MAYSIELLSLVSYELFLASYWLLVKGPSGEVKTTLEVEVKQVGLNIGMVKNEFTSDPLQ